MAAELNRIQIASAAFLALATVDVALTAADHLGYIDLNLSTVDLVVSCITVPLSAATAVLLWKRKLLGWWLANSYVAFNLLDGIRGELTLSESWIDSAVVLSLVALLFSGILWLVSVDRVGEFFESPLPEIRPFNRRPSRLLLQAGVMLLGIGIAGLIWAPLILVVWLTVLASLLRGRHSVRE